MKLRYSLALFLCQLLTVTAAFATATVKFANPVLYGSGGSGTNFVVAADLRLSGYPDMIVANRDGVSVLLNNFDGTFAPPVTYGTGGTNAFAVAVGDVNGDGIPDLVVTNYCNSSCNNGNVGVLIGIGDGTFQPAVSYGAGGLDTRGVVIGDVNNDTWPDIIVTSNCQTKTCVDGSIRLLLNKQDGTFALTPTAIAPSMGGPLAIGDLNGDGNLDLVADIGVLLGNGDGTFTQDTSVTLPGGTISIALADVNHDSFLDVVVADQVSVKVQLGDGTGNLGSPVAYKSGGKRVLSVAVADFNGDGNPDIAVVNECSTLINNVCSSTGSLGVLAGNGNGTFQPFVSYVSGGNLATSVAVADVNADTKPDILVSNVCVSTSNCTNGVEAVFLNIFKAATSIHVSSNPNPSNVNQPVTFMATLTSQVPIPDGSEVDFFNGITLIGSGTTTGGVATFYFSAGFLHPGPKSIKATFSDIYHNAASGTLTQTVNLWPSTTTVTADPNPATYPTPVTFTATVSSSAPGGATGTVTFTNVTTNTVFGTATLSGGVAMFTAPHPKPGTSTIRATYNGDSQSATSSGTTPLTVN